MFRRTTLAVVVVAALTTAVFSTPAPAGPIDPPPGPVAPTYKTLAEVEPRRPLKMPATPIGGSSVILISQPGSYYLTENITVPAGKNGVTIAVSDVVLDLNGFTIAGEPGSQDGVYIFFGCQRVTLRNGVVRSCGGNGVHGDDLLTDSATLEGLTVAHCAGHGIISGLRSTVRHCTAHANGGNGIMARFATRVHDCTATSNGGDGIVLESVSSATGCTLQANTGWGIRGADNARVERCHLNANTAGGISVANASTVLANSIDFHPNVHALRAAGGRNTLDGNTITRAGVGISADGTNNLIVRNALSGCATPTIIVGGNVHGPFIHVPAGADLGAVPNAGHAAANFVY